MEEIPIRPQCLTNKINNPTKSIIMERDMIDNLVKEVHYLRDKVYSTLNEQWTNSYGKDQFEKAVQSLTEAAICINLFY